MDDLQEIISSMETISNKDKKKLSFLVHMLEINKKQMKEFTVFFENEIMKERKKYKIKFSIAGCIGVAIGLVIPDLLDSLYFVIVGK